VPAVPLRIPLGLRPSLAGFTTKATMFFRKNRMAFDTACYCGLGRSQRSKLFVVQLGTNRRPREQICATRAGLRPSLGVFTTKATMSFRMNRIAFDTARYCGLGGSQRGATWEAVLPIAPGVPRFVKSRAHRDIASVGQTEPVRPLLAHCKTLSQAVPSWLHFR
jgi:hypothetical protein